MNAITNLISNVGEDLVSSYDLSKGAKTIFKEVLFSFGISLSASWGATTGTVSVAFYGSNDGVTTNKTALKTLTVTTGAGSDGFDYAVPFGYKYIVAVITATGASGYLILLSNEKK